MRVHKAELDPCNDSPEIRHGQFTRGESPIYSHRRWPPVKFEFRLEGKIIQPFILLLAHWITKGLVDETHGELSVRRTSICKLL